MSGNGHVVAVKNIRECLICGETMLFGTSPICSECDPQAIVEREQRAARYWLQMELKERLRNVEGLLNRFR